MTDPFENMEPVWKETNWFFKSKKTGNIYDVYDLIDLDRMKNVPLVDGYMFKALGASGRKDFPVFVMTWLKMIHDLVALYVAEEAHRTFLASAQKVDGKVYKKADAEYNKAYDEYYYRYGNM